MRDGRTAYGVNPTDNIRSVWSCERHFAQSPSRLPIVRKNQKEKEYESIKHRGTCGTFRMTATYLPFARVVPPRRRPLGQCLVSKVAFLFARRLWLDR